MSTYPGLFTRVFAPSDLLGLTAKTLISDCVHGQTDSDAALLPYLIPQLGSHMSGAASEPGLIRLAFKFVDACETLLL